MATLADFIFFDETSTTTTSNSFSLPYGTEVVTVQVDAINGASVSASVEGTTEIGGTGEWYPLTVLNNTGYAASESISEAGIYSIAGEGIRLLRMKNAGSAGTIKAHAVAVGGL